MYAFVQLVKKRSKSDRKQNKNHTKEKIKIARFSLHSLSAVCFALARSSQARAREKRERERESFLTAEKRVLLTGVKFVLKEEEEYIFFYI